MSIRWKLLVLLSGIALLPVVLLAVLDYRGLQSLGADLAGDTRRVLTDRTTRQLQQLIQEQTAYMRRRKESLEHVLRTQARAVERLLAAAAPAEPAVYFSRDFDRGGLEGIEPAPSARHYRFPQAGGPQRIAVSYDAQVFKLAPGVSQPEVAPLIAHLADMSAEYRFLNRSNPDLIYWQFTALDAGVHSSYPGHGGYPDEYDPRARDWYRQARDQNRLVWIGPYHEVSSEQLILTLSMPLRDLRGEFVGVTGIDVSVADIVDEMTLPPIWSDHASSMLVSLVSPVGVDVPFARVLAKPGYHQRGERWNASFDADVLESDDADGTARLLAAMDARQRGRERMPYRGTDALWVYGPVDDEGVYLVLIIPYADVIAPAVAAEREVRERTDSQARLSAALAGFVFLLVLLCALAGSRTVTQPIRALADAADDIAQGEFSTRVPVRSNDEIGRLGQRFNAMVPQLEERMELKHSLELAMEVQQNLLPTSAPIVNGLDIAGQSIYCDETGGDYYDFIDLTRMGPNQIGVAIGDVTGHGIAAALLMTTARAVLRSQAAESTDLATLMNALNRYLVADMDGGQFMTLYYLTVDAQQRQARWISAGHDPAIVYDPRSDSFSELLAGDIPLGIEQDWKFKAHGPATLEPGWVIVIGTDGIWEARNPPGEFFGKERLYDCIRSAAGGSASEIRTAITETLDAFRRSHPQEDDVTLVVIKVTGNAA